MSEEKVSVLDPSRDPLYKCYMAEVPKRFTEITPGDLVKFRTLSHSAREADGPEFFRKDHIANYMDKKWAIELFNRDTYLGLLELSKKYPGDGDLLAKMYEFEDAIRRTDHPFNTLRIKLPEVNARLNKEEQVEVAQMKKFWSERD